MEKREAGIQTENRGAFLAVETRSHGAVKGKHFVDDGKTEKRCWPW